MTPSIGRILLPAFAVLGISVLTTGADAAPPMTTPTLDNNSAIAVGYRGYGRGGRGYRGGGGYGRHHGYRSGYSRRYGRAYGGGGYARRGGYRNGHAQRYGHGYGGGGAYVAWRLFRDLGIYGRGHGGYRSNYGYRSRGYGGNRAYGGNGYGYGGNNYR